MRANAKSCSDRKMVPPPPYVLTYLAYLDPSVITLFGEMGGTSRQKASFWVLLFTRMQNGVGKLAPGFHFCVLYVVLGE